MDDTIYRQAAIDAIRAFYDEFIVYDNGKSIEDLISELPSAQPGITLESAIDYLHSIGWMQEHDRTLTESAQPERKKGKWIQIIKGEHGYSAGDFRCSVCEQPNPCHHLTKFCPNCGARMEGIDETD